MKINSISIPVSIGELYDKVSILLIKKDLIKDEKKLINIEKEYDELMLILNPIRSMLEGEEKDQENELFKEILSINKVIWNQVDKMRDFVKKFDNNEEIDHRQVDDNQALGMCIFETNNKRFETKRKIDDFYGSEIKEEKSCI